MGDSPPVAHEPAITTADEKRFAIFSRVSILTRLPYHCPVKVMIETDSVSEQDCPAYQPELFHPGGSCMPQHSHIEIGFQVYTVEGGETFGAVRAYVPHGNALVIYIENAGDFEVPLEAVHRVHDGKVIVDIGRLDARLREAIAHAHDREEPNL
jgi:hypothetical protein